MSRLVCGFYICCSRSTTAVVSGWTLDCGQWTGGISCTSIMPHVTARPMLLMSRADRGEGFGITSPPSSFAGRTFSQTSTETFKGNCTGQRPTLVDSSDFLLSPLVTFFVPVYLKVFLSEAVPPTDPSALSNSVDSAAPPLTPSMGKKFGGVGKRTQLSSVRPSAVFGSDDSFSSRYPIIRLLFTRRVGGLQGEPPSRSAVLR